MLAARVVSFVIVLGAVSPNSHGEIVLSPPVPSGFCNSVEICWLNASRMQPGDTIRFYTSWAGTCKDIFGDYPCHEQPYQAQIVCSGAPCLTDADIFYGSGAIEASPTTSGVVTFDLQLRNLASGEWASFPLTLRVGSDAEICATHPANTDGDDECDAIDRCPEDVTDDSDADGLCDSDDPCPVDRANDADGDGACEVNDRCPRDNPDDEDGDDVCASEDPCIGQNATGDADGDGYCGDADCDDSKAGIHPGAPEACDGFDYDCDGSIVDGFSDSDGDGQPECEKNPPPTSGCSSGGSNGYLTLVALALSAFAFRRQSRFDEQRPPIP